MKKIVLMIIVAMAFTVNANAQQSRADYIEGLRMNVESICRSLQPFMQYPDELSAVGLEDVPEINAYADGDGNVVFFMGMLDFVRSEHEIAAVCAHELAHLSGKHISKSTKTGILATVAQVALGGTLGDIAGSAIYTKKSRSFERESDENGLLYMWRAGYDPRAVWKFWQAMQNHHGKGMGDIENYFSTHPVTGERIENLQVLLVRYCKADGNLPYCTEILNDQSLVDLYNGFEARR